MGIATVLLATFAMLLPTATAREVQVPGYFAYASCSPDRIHHSETTHVCNQGDLIRAVLRYSEGPLDYEICLRFGVGDASCGPVRRAEPGTSSIAYLSSRDFVGLVTVSWRVGTRTVRSWNLRFVKDPVVPAFGINPLIVAGTHRLFGLLLRHVTPGLRVRAWRQCPGGCPLPLRLASRRGETRRYRIVGPNRIAIFSLGDLLYVQVDAPGQRFRGSKLWGRLYRAKLVRDRRGGPDDTAIRRIGPILCTPPGAGFGRASDCDAVPGVKNAQ